MPSPRVAGSIILRALLFLFPLICIWAVAACATPPIPAAPVDNPSVDVLMGGTGRAELAARLAQTGKTWEQYSAWGKELFFNGSVQNPPEGVGPSPRISKLFTCNNCHNVVREDTVLTDQNPEARLAYFQQTGGNVFLTQGMTFWGAVNRTSFYNDAYAVYRGLCVPETTTNTQIAIGGPDAQGKCSAGTRTMNAASFEDAIQICSSYCSVGRYLTRWELDAMEAYFWDLELHLSDLGLTAPQEQMVRRALVPLSPDAPLVAQARALVYSKYLHQAGDHFRDVPTITQNAVGAYPDGQKFVGDPTTGKAVYEKACAHCHNGIINSQQGAALVSDLQTFYTILAKGKVQPDQRYMPEFTLERLSRQQSADVQTYLQQLGE